jgi:transmembrane sensor
MSRRFDALTAELAALHAQAHGRDRAARHAAMRADVLARAFAPRRRVAPRWAIATGVLAVATAVLVLGLARWSSGPLTFRVEANASDAPAQAFFVTEDAPQTMTFSDGSTLELGPRSRLRVVARRSDGADVVLETGSLTARLADGGAWSIDAGPHQVVAVGAEFELRWSADAATLELSAARGSVALRGAEIDGERVVAIGERVRLGPEVAAAPIEVVVAPPPRDAVEPPPSATTIEAPRVAPRRPARPSAPEADWRALARAGRYDAALDAAKGQGFAALCTSLDADGLLQLADVGRYGGDVARAREALLALRKRFAGSDAAATAAFDLGRLATGKAARCTTAVSWFETYVRERPRGAMVDAARERIAECRGP